MSLSEDMCAELSHPHLPPFEATIPYADANDAGLLGLPNELLFEIVSHLPSLPFPLVWRSHPTPYLKKPISPDEPKLARAETLRALSQTCRSLRSFALPLAWESIDVISSRFRQSAPSKWKEDLARSLVKQLEFVTRVNPDLATYVKSIAVLLSDSATIDATYELARCLTLFPNLHTIQLLGNMGSAVDFSDALEKKSFPSVRRVVLAPFAQALLKCCPNVQAAHAVLDPARPRDLTIGRAMLQDVVRFCPEVEELIGFPIDWTKDLIDIHKGCPNLRVVPIHIRPGEAVLDLDIVACFPLFQNLERIIIDVPVDGIMTEEGHWYMDIEDLIDECLDVLAMLPVSEKMTPTRYWPLVEKWVKEEEEITPASLIFAPLPLLNGHSRQPPLVSTRMKGIKFLTVNISETPLFIDMVIGPEGINPAIRSPTAVFYQKGERTHDVFQEVQYTARPVICMRYLGDSSLPPSNSDGELDSSSESD